MVIFRVKVRIRFRILGNIDHCVLIDSTAQGNIKEWGHTNKSKITNKHTKHKPRLNTHKNTQLNHAV